MNAFKSITAIALSLCCSFAAAAPITSTFTGPVTITSGSPHSFSHNLLGYGFVVGVDQLLSATYTLILTDPLGGDEQAHISFGGAVMNPPGNNDVDGTYTYSVTYNAAALDALEAAGQLAVNLATTGQGRSYVFSSSSLVFEIAEREAEVPEPMSLGLMAIGLAGFGVARRRKAA